MDGGEKLDSSLPPAAAAAAHLADDNNLIYLRVNSTIQGPITN
jgi:hypothetical protein